MIIIGSEDPSPDAEIRKVILSQLGLLENDIARDMVIFGNMLDGLRVDLKAMGQLDALPPAEKIRILKQDLKLWNDTLDLGKELVRRLK